MKKVLYVATVASHICQFHLPYMKAFQEKGYQVHVAAKDNLAEKNGLKLQYADEFFNLPFERSPIKKANLTAYKKLKEIFAKEKYDIVVCNTPTGGILTRMAAQKERKTGTKVVYIAHGFHFYKGGPKKSWLIYYPIEKLFAKKCDVLVTINEEDYLLAKKKFKTRVERIHGIGVDGLRYSPIDEAVRKEEREKFAYSEDEFIALVVGELLPNKNQMQAIQAVEEVQKTHKNIRLLIAGNGRERENLERYVEEHGLKNHVTFLGYCTNLQEYQRIVDVGVSCSIREGLGLNVIEAMLSGNTFIATRNRGHNELIQDNENGFLVDVGDWQTLATRMKELMDDQALKEKMATTAKERIRPYSLEETIVELGGIFESL